MSRELNPYDLTDGSKLEILWEAFREGIRKITQYEGDSPTTVEMENGDVFYMYKDSVTEKDL